jgi:outer membrane lipoprotein-sorting protein
MMLTLTLGFMLVLAGCGEKSQTEVVDALTEKMNELKGYKADAKMTLKMGTEPQVYDVEVWYQSPSNYRVNLKNAQKDQSQIILRNEEGVFVLTPALNKSFKFQSEWPKNSSQAYLYESLITDVTVDKDATFKATDDNYVFETKTRYQNNKMLPLQVVKFDRKTLEPVSVDVMDSDRNTLVQVEFEKTKFNPNYSNSDFDVKKNMTGAQLEVPVMSSEEDIDFETQYPTAEIQGVEPAGEKMIKTEDGKRAVLTFAGDEKQYTLIETKSKIVKEAAVTIAEGEPVDLGFTIGNMTENSISWSYEGIDFMLAAKNLTSDEMIMVAKSVQETAEK